MRVGRGDFGGRAAGRRPNRVGGVASGRAQIKREARRAPALGRPRRLPAPGGATSSLSLSPARLQLAAAETAGESARDRRLRRARPGRGRARRCARRWPAAAAAPGAPGGLPRYGARGPAWAVTVLGPESPARAAAGRGAGEQVQWRKRGI